ncbi:MAG TPA: folylpolyglutamate synthase/dihydrofolate synthase family protein [Saprospiraceae bacterium]|nr:folylpolyglutamate synthase/dihydrofolate synthase family protein [Saprospiraceae bacterium]
MSAYRETLSFLYSHLPMYQRVGSVAFKKGLGNTRALLESLGQPHLQYPCIHIAGTNGKGTVSHMLAACLTAAGFRTGLYISPHYRDFRERIRIDGKMVPKRDVVEFVTQLRPVIEMVRPSFFEMTVAMAFDAFARHDVDIAVIETGLGGRLDSTNVIKPLLSVITNISFDHMAMLGNTLPKIGYEKAGIIKKNTPVVIGEYQSKVAPVFKSVSKQRKAPITFANRKLHAELVHDSLNEQIYNVSDRKGLVFYERLRIGCAGPFQSANLITSLQALHVLGQVSGTYALTEVQIRKGFGDIRALSGYQGRWQVLGKNPLILADSAHNPGGLSIILDRIRTFAHPQKHFVIGFVNDKDLDSVLGLFPADASYYFCRPNIPRGLETVQLKAIAEMYSLEGQIYSSVRKALNAARRAAKRTDFIFVGGSTFVVAEVI